MSRPVIEPHRIRENDSKWERFAHVSNGARSADAYRSARVTAMNYNGSELRIDVDAFYANDSGVNDGKPGSRPDFKVIVAQEAEVYVNGTRIWPPQPHVWRPKPEIPHLCVACGKSPGAAPDWHTGGEG